jgi:hypothetical protein
MNWSIVNALPLGLVMFLGLVWGVYRRRVSYHRAREDYPALAERLGLHFRPSYLSQGIGQLYGTIAGYSVLIDPDDQRKIIVRFNGAPNIDLRNYESPKRSSFLQYFAFRERRANEYFKTRFASPEIAERCASADVNSLLKPFLERYKYEVKQLNVTTHGATCVLDFGNPPHIPVTAIEELLPALINWAELIEPRLIVKR